MAVPSLLATLRGLHEAGAWLVPYQDVPNPKPENPGKCKAVPTQEGWKDNRIEWEAIERHVQGGGAVGLIPASLGLVVVDVDADPGYAAADLVESVEEEIGAPVCSPVRSRSGGFHLYYRAPDGVEIGNHTWSAGDIRHASGFVRLSETAAAGVAVALENMADYEPVDAGAWPFADTGDGADVGPETVGRVQDGAGRYDPAEALKRLNPDMEYDSWLKVGMALHAHGLPLEMWDAWSAGGLNYERGLCAAKWRGFRKDGGVKIGTLFMMAGMYKGKRKKPLPRLTERRRRAAMRTLNETGIGQALSAGRFSVLKQITWLSANERGYSYAGRVKIAKRAGLGVWWTAETLRYLVDAGLLVAHGKDDPDRYAPGRAPSCYSVDFERVEGYVSEWRAAAASRKARAQAQTEKARAARAANRKADERTVEGDAMAAETDQQDETADLKAELRAELAAAKALRAELQDALDAAKAERRRGPLSYPEAAAGLQDAPSKPEYLKTVIAGLYPTERVNGNVDVNAISQALGTGTAGILKAIYEQWRRNPDPRLAVHNRLQRALN